jgi:hypothetical protein
VVFYVKDVMNMNTIRILGSPLYQWEVGRKVEVFPYPNRQITSVHFCHAGDAEALVVKPKIENGMTVVQVPNILLQDGANLLVYVVDVVDDSIETLRECVLPVRSRPKPADYVYTETEVLTYKRLEKQIESLDIINLYVCSDGEYAADGSPMIPKPDKETAYLVPQDNEGILYASWVYVNGAWKFVEMLTVTLDETEGGKGEPGKDGYTPVKGKDYFTDADKAEMINAVKAALPIYAGEVIAV